MAQFIVIPQPQTAANLGGDHAVFKRYLIFSCPDAALIEIEFVIYSQEAVARTRVNRRAEKQRQQCTPEQPADDRAAARDRVLRGRGEHTLQYKVPAIADSRQAIFRCAYFGLQSTAHSPAQGKLFFSLSSVAD